MATAGADYYDLLELSRNAGPEEIKKAFRRLAMQYHPDRNQEPSAEARFKQISEAYEILSDPEKKERYDRFGHAGLNGVEFGRGFEGSDLGGFGDIFDAFFGGATTRRTREAQRGADRRVDIEITFEDAAFGTERELKVDRVEHCTRCAGSGNEPGASPARCASCEGSGQVRRVSKNFFGQFVNIASCGPCRGTGQIVTDPCKDCRGAGRQKQARVLRVSIPAGIGDGSRMRLSGEGDTGQHGGPPGHLYVYIGVEEHAFFKREEENLIYELEMNPAQASLGFEAEIPTLDGEDASLKIPAGTQSGKVFSLKGKGIPRLHAGGRGDLLVLAHVLIPTELSDEQRELLKKLADTFGTPVADKGLLGKLKDALS